MRDARVGEHTLHVRLHEGEHVAHGHRCDREYPEDLLPVEVERRECGEEETGDPGEGRRLHADRHEGGDRRRRPLVDVGRPELERNDRRLEAECDDEQREAAEDRDPRCGTEPGADAVVARGPRRAVEGGDTVEQEAGRECPQDEVLERRLARRTVASMDARQHVGRERHDLDAEEQQDQVARGGHDHHARGREENQRVELAGAHPDHLEIALRHEHRHRGG